MRFKISDSRFQIGVQIAVAALAIGLAASAPIAQEAPSRRLLDETLDLYVRDGFVYYRALRSDRSRLDRYVSSIATAPIASSPREERIAFWINAYNALVLKTVIDHYPIGQRSRDYPPRSIRQIPGAFERLTHRIAARTITLDQIEQAVLPEFEDPRVYLALGRGAVGSGRLRSEAYAPAVLERQLSEVANECTTRSQCIHLDRAENKVVVSSIFSWRQKEFAAAYADKADKMFSSRSPIERAVLALAAPRLLTIERDFLEKNQFKVEYLPFDWSLNDLTGRGGR
jgi:hypothetical protein